MTALETELKKFQRLNPHLSFVQCWRHLRALRPSLFDDARPARSNSSLSAGRSISIHSPPVARRSVVHASESDPDVVVCEGGFATKIVLQ